jgi:hypothetical protein
VLSLLREEQVVHHLIFYLRLFFIKELYQSFIGLTFIIIKQLPLLCWPINDLLRAFSVNSTAILFLIQELVSFISILSVDPQ